MLIRDVCLDTQRHWNALISVSDARIERQKSAKVDVAFQKRLDQIDEDAARRRPTPNWMADRFLLKLLLWTPKTPSRSELTSLRLKDISGKLTL